MELHRASPGAAKTAKCGDEKLLRKRIDRFTHARGARQSRPRCSTLGADDFDPQPFVVLHQGETFTSDRNRSAFADSADATSPLPKKAGNGLGISSAR